MNAVIKNLWEQGSLRSQDYFFADFIGRACGSDDKNLLLAAALVSRAVGEGNVCLDLAAHSGSAFPMPENMESDDSSPEEYIISDSITLPSGNEWLKSLNNRQACACVCKPEDKIVKPLVLDGQCLYLYRYWRYERLVADALIKMSKPYDKKRFPDRFGEKINACFEVPGHKKDDEKFMAALRLQKTAALTVFRSRLALISGGPGTGKTYVIARALALLAEDSIERNRPVRILLAAPTGKAAMRMMESIREAKKTMQVAEKILSVIPEEASTIHRLLGNLPGSPYFRHNAENPLDADAVILDEASMIDLPLMAKLLEALPASAGLILLGDMNQLVSVEPGHVFGDICSAAGAPRSFSGRVLDDCKTVFGKDFKDESISWNGAPGLGDCLVKLDYSIRFPPDGPIGRISRAVVGESEDPDGAWKELSFPAHAVDGAKIMRHETPAGLYDKDRRPVRDLRHAVLAGYKNYLDAETLEDAFKALNSFRILSTFRRGSYGIAGLNRLIENILSLRDVKKETIRAEYKPAKPLAPDSEFYELRPVMIARNNYSLNLFNGDIGIVLDAQSDLPGPVEGDKPLKRRVSNRRVAYFERTDSAGARVYIPVPVNMLPPHETAFAMTIHKVQGSEFDRTLILLPPFDHKLLTRDMLYTAITRAKHEVDLWCGEEVFKKMISRKTRRASGLRVALMKKLPGKILPEY